MRQLQPVVWSKGVFLSPQHLQAQDRFFEESLRFLADALAFRNWGLSSLQIDGTAMSEGQLSVSQASGVFPDGLMLDMPGSDAPPHSRTLEECFQPGTNRCGFFLAIPQDRPGGINIGLQRTGINTRFYSELQMLRDENSTGIEKPVSLARKNLQILAEGENLEGSVLLPLAQIERTEAGSYRLDTKYVPPMLNLKGNELLTGILRGLIETLVGRSGQLAGTRRQRNQSLADFSASDVANFWLLYTINSNLPVLRHMLQSNRVHPETLFLQMLTLAGSLTTFSPKVEPRDLPEYDHEQLGPCFIALDAMIAELLDTVVPAGGGSDQQDSVAGQGVLGDAYRATDSPGPAGAEDAARAGAAAGYPGKAALSVLQPGTLRAGVGSDCALAQFRHVRSGRDPQSRDGAGYSLRHSGINALNGDAGRRPGSTQSQAV
jgi:type VI secretion system protein ImpJ